MKERNHSVRRLMFVLWLIPAQVSAGTLLVDQVNPYLLYGYGLFFWNHMTKHLNSAFGAGNITVSASPLTNLPYLLGFDSLWITPRQPGDPGLSATEQSNVQAFLATGRRVALLGENHYWATWNNTILATVGGSYSEVDTSAALTPVVAHPLTAGITSLRTLSDGIATGGTSLFSQNVITLWGGSQNVVSMLSFNIIDYENGDGWPDGEQFERNLATWLAGGAASGVPEPSTCLLLASGVALISVRRLLHRYNSWG